LLETNRAAFAAAGGTVMRLPPPAAPSCMWRRKQAAARRARSEAGGRLGAASMSHGLVGAGEGTSWSPGLTARFIDSVFLAIVGGTAEEQTQ
jgi:hypothetical protein